jgi:hypothetical protein
MILSGCASTGGINEAPPQGKTKKQVRVTIDIIDQTNRFRYYGISVNKTHPDTGTLMFYRIKWIDKKNEILFLDKRSQYRIDLYPSKINPLKNFKKNGQLKIKNSTAKKDASSKNNKDNQILRKYITPRKDNQHIRFVIR